MADAHEDVTRTLLSQCEVLKEIHEYSEYVGRFLVVPTGEVGKYGHSDNRVLLQLKFLCQIK
jgi:hypothetical protein